MDRLTSHRVLQIVVVAAFASLGGLACVAYFLDPEVRAPWPGILFAFLAGASLTCFLAPALYLVKKARLRGAVGGMTVFSALRQSFWFSLWLAGCWFLFHLSALSLPAALYWAGVLFFTECLIRSRLPKRLHFRPRP